MIAIFHDQEIMSAVADKLYQMDTEIDSVQEAV
jgi:alpha-D-ribose 1-methylphosphonate 5-triphosphate synthase subunit PhnL